MPPSHPLHATQFCPKLITLPSRPSCSLVCYRPHKAEHEKSKQEPGNPVELTPAGPGAAEKNTCEERNVKDEAAEKDTDVFAPLLESPEIQRMLASPSLRRHLLNIHKATLEPPPAFVHRGRGGRGRGRGGRGGWEQSSPRPWNAEKGTRAGIGKVKKLREENTEVEEFVNMVVDLVEKKTASEEG